jgi:hypothetical protein
LLGEEKRGWPELSEFPLFEIKRKETKITDIFGCLFEVNKMFLAARSR